MSFHDLACLPSKSSVYTSFHIDINCGRGESLMGATRLDTVVGVSMGMLPVKCFCSIKSFLCQSNFMEIIILSQS